MTGSFSFPVISPIDFSARKIAYTFTLRNAIAEGSDYKSVSAGI
jgi:hypothetical protein